MRTSLLPLALLAAAGLLAACGGGGGGTPAEMLAAADGARSARDFDQALALYEKVAAAPSAGADQSFKASLEGVKCLVALGRAEEAVKRYQAMFDSHAAQMADPAAYKHTLAVLSTLIEEKAETRLAIELLGLAKEKHPAQQENFQKWVDELKKRGLDDSELAALKDLGYL